MMRITPSITMLGIKDDIRRIAQDILHILAIKPGEAIKTSKYSTQFQGVDADEVYPGIFIGNK